jgi:DNA-directed RNA polymerase specialized sigma24 family protein
MPLSTTRSVTLLIRGIRGGDLSGVTPLWAHYFERLTRHANNRLRFDPRLESEDEDTALEAFNDVCKGLANGKFEYVDSREQLWGLMAKITERKANRILNKTRWKREVLFTDLQPTGAEAGDGSTRAIYFEPSMEYQHLVRVEIKELIDRLPKDLWRETARMLLEGYTIPEIAVKLNRTRKCVDIWLRAIQALWEERLGREILFD